MNTVATATLPTVKIELPTGLLNNRASVGWTLLEDVPLIGNEELELVNFFPDDEYFEYFFHGSVVFDRAVKLGNRAGWLHAEHLLRYDVRIPEEWRSFLLVFSGTRWRDSAGDDVVLMLGWDNTIWDLSWKWINTNWGGRMRLVRFK